MANEGFARRALLRSIGAAGLVGAGTVGARGPNGRGRLRPPTPRGSLEQAVVTGAEPGATVTLYERGGGEYATADADDFGSYVFTDVEPGPGYQVTQTVDGEESPPSNAVRVLGEADTPPRGFYRRQTLTEGFGYLEVRDGTTLACQVTFPDADEWGPPPYPVIVDYSGYEPSTSFWDGIDDVFTSRGYAVAGVNKRGTACSGGKFDFMEPLQWYDGYDLVEVLGAQRWADGVGLAGKSYPGYTQLYVAATRPPSLRAIAPGHVVGDFYRDVGYPGGILNATFAGSWARNRDEEAAPGGDRGDVDERIAAGDELCEANQRLRLQNPGLLERLLGTPFATEFFEARSAWNLVDRIETPTMLVMSWQDEQTASRPTRLLERFPDGTPVRLVASNGDHGEYFGPAVFADVERFFSYYLKEEVPEDVDEPYAEALAAYESSDPIQVYWELDRTRSPRFETTHATWPPADVETWTLYARPDGGLADAPPTDAEPAASAYEYAPRPPTEQLIGRDDEGRLLWPEQPAGTFVAFESEPLDSDRVLLGSASAELWLRSTADDTDVEVTLSEVRPDGSELYVQNGWLRAGHRAEDPDRSNPRRPWHTHAPGEYAPLPDGEFARLRVELFPFGHAFREGSRVRLAVETPGGNRDRWGFELLDEPATNEVAHAPEHPSTVKLPLLAGAEAGVPEPPACGDVRSQPCRLTDGD